MDIPETPTYPQPRKEESVVRSYSFGLFVALMVMGSFVLGVFIGGLRPAVSQEQEHVASEEQEVALVNRQAKPPFMLKDVDFAAFWDVWDMVQDRYAGEGVTDVDMFYGAVEGMVGSLGDPYSTFFDPKLAQKFVDELEGTFQGIGTEIGMKKNQLTAIAPLPDSPAERAGLRAGDKIVLIDETETYGMYLDEAVRLIRGPKGTEVVLTVVRKGVGEPIEIPIIRDTIVVEPIRVTVREQDGKRISVVRISHFNESTFPKFSEAIREMLLNDTDGVVIDLRNNPGGFLETAVKIAGEWVPRDVIVVEQFSDDSSHNYTSNGNARLEDMPTVVLVNGGSASASEIVAGALQDYEKAAVIGEVTFGKGSVQDYVQFEDGSALKLTIARWLTPKGRSINEEGIAPDEEVELTNEDFDEDRDPQLDRAIEVLVNGGEVLTVKDE